MASWKRDSDMVEAGAPITAVVVSFNSAFSLDDCLLRLRAAQGLAGIVLVDNGSTDASIDIARRHVAQDPRVTMLQLPDNPGFSVACNAGAAASHTSWLAFVNPDCLLEPDCLQRLLDTAARSAEGVGVLGADLIDVEGRPDPAARRRDPDPGELLRALGSPRKRHIDNDGRELQYVDAVSGALMLMPMEAFTAVGGFDPGYRLHAEDLDLCRRVRAAGFAVAVANAVRVTHLRGTSSRQRPVWVEWQKHRSLQRYFTRFAREREPWAWRCAIGLAIWSRFLLAALRAWWRAHR
jgi:hypothetical protein